MTQFTEFVRSELNELESRDIDQLFSCIRDNLIEMGLQMTDSLDGELYSTIEKELNQ